MNLLLSMSIKGSCLVCTVVGQKHTSDYIEVSFYLFTLQLEGSFLSFYVDASPGYDDKRPTYVFVTVERERSERETKS